MQNRSPIDCSFLQVTINSNKLMQILDRLSKQSHEHGNEIKILRDAMPSLKQSVMLSLDNTQGKIREYNERCTQKLKEDMLGLKNQVNVLEQQVNRIKITQERRARETESKFATIDQQKVKMEAVVAVNEQKRVTEQLQMEQKVAAMKQTIGVVQEELRDNDNKTDDKFQMIFIKMQGIISKSVANGRGENQLSNKGKKQRKPSASSKVKDKKNISLSNWAQFSTKLNDFQKKAEESINGLPVLNKILYSKTPVAKIENQVNFQEQLDEQKNQIESGGYNIEAINSMFQALSQHFQKSLAHINNKLVIHQEKFDINTRKIEKALHFVAEMKIQVRKLQEKKTDDHYAQIFRNQLKKIHYEMSEEFEKRVTKQIYDKDRTKTVEKISILQENITQKAQKGEMKKAFFFLQQKIKQLILVIASHQNEQKDGAVRKIPAKCLSCDKDLETERTNPNSRLPSPRESVTRTVTRRIKNRIQLSHQNSLISM